MFWTHCALFLAETLVVYRYLGLDLTRDGTSKKGRPSPDVRSPYYLVELANYERMIASMLSEFVTGQALPAEFSESIQEYLDGNMNDVLATKDFPHQSPTNDSALMIAHNPMLVFKMVWRFANELRNIHGHFLKHEHSLPESPTKTYFSDEDIFSTWPTSKTIDECIVGILRLQMVYDLDAKDLASGIILGIQTGAKLSIQQCLQFGILANTSSEYTSSIPWLELVIEKLEANEPNGANIRSDNVRVYLESVIADHDKSWENKNNTDYYTEKLVKNNTLLKLQERIPMRKVDRSSDVRKKQIKYNECNFWSLCTGDNHQTENEKSELFCWYETKLHPALTVYPIKTEMLSKTPRILQMYGMIHDSTISKLLNLAKPVLKRSLVVDPENFGTTVESKQRTSVEGWVYESQPVSKLTELIEFVTGLDLTGEFASEPYLVASYAFGGHYDCHLDGFQHEDEFYMGNRIATMMFYMDDTQEGGFTAFPWAGVAAKPIKGSAVFWYNLKRNGARDEDTYHCACPVVLGHKIISTKWIRSHDQFQNKPCTLLKDD